MRKVPRTAKLALILVGVLTLLLASTRRLVTYTFGPAARANNFRVQGTPSPSGGAIVSRGAILFVIKTAPQYYNARALLALETWVEEWVKHQSSVMIVGHQRGTIVTGAGRTWDVQAADNLGKKRGCGNDHDVGLHCLEANAWIYAHRRAQRERFEWVFFVDDDMYVHVPNLRERVSRYNASDPFIYAQVGCGNGFIDDHVSLCGDNSGICGGGGYLVSASTVRQVIKGNRGRATGEGAEKMFLSKFKETAGIIGGGGWSDVALTCVAHSRGRVSTREMPGLEPYAYNGMEMLEMLRERATVTFHYVRGEYCSAEGIGKEMMVGVRGLHMLMTHKITPSELCKRFHCKGDDKDITEEFCSHISW